MTLKRENHWRKKFEEAVMACWTQTKILKLNVGAFSSIGVPDLYIASRGLGEVWLELKYVRPDACMDWSKQPTLLQKEQLRGLYYAGARVGVVVFFEEWWTSVHQGDLVGPLGALRCDEKWDSASPHWQYRYNSSYDNEADYGFKSLVFGCI